MQFTSPADVRAALATIDTDASIEGHNAIANLVQFYGQALARAAKSRADLAAKYAAALQEIAALSAAAKGAKDAVQEPGPSSGDERKGRPGGDPA